MAEGKKSTGPKMKQAGNKNSQIDLNRPNEEQMSIKEKLMNQPKVMVSLNSTGDARPVIIDGVEYLSEGDVERVKIGGVPWFIPRGVMVEVPKAVAELLNNNKITVNYFNGELKRNFKNNYKDILKYSNI
jgi:hypothetical protein